MDTFNKTTLKEVRSRLDEALLNIIDELGIDLKVGTMTYSPDGATFTTKIEGAVFGSDGKVQDKTFVSGGREYTIVGLNARANKFPVHVTAHGKNYKVGADMVRARMTVPLATVGKVYEGPS
jgi:hypothetical protein